LDPLRRDFKGPGARERDWKSDDDQDDEQSNEPVRNVEDWKDLRDALRKRPTGDDVSDGDLVNIPPLQLAEKIVHSSFVRNYGAFGKAKSSIRRRCCNLHEGCA